MIEQSAIKQIYDPQLTQIIRKLFNIQYLKNDIDDLCCYIRKGTIVQQMKGLIGLKYILQHNEDWQQITQKIIQNKVVPIMLDYLDQDAYAQLKVEASWIITIVILQSKDNANMFKQLKNIVLFSKLLQSELVVVCTNSICCLIELSESIKSTKQIIIKKSLNRLLNLLQNTDSKNILQKGYYLLATLTELYNFPQFEQASQIMSQLCKAVANETIRNLSTIKLVFSALLQFCEANYIVQCQILPILKKCFIEKEEQISLICWKIIRKLSINCCESKLSKIISKTIIFQLQKHLCHNSIEMRSTVCEVLYYLCLKSKNYTQKLLRKQLLASFLVNLLKYDKVEIKQIICYLLTNSISKGSYKIIADISLKYNIFNVFIGCLQSESDKLVIAVLDTMMKMLSMSNILINHPLTKQMAEILNNSEGLYKLLKLSESYKLSIAGRSLKIMDKYCTSNS